MPASTVTVPRITPTAADVQQAAKLAAVVEISRKLNKSLYAVTQADLRRFKHLEGLIERMTADREILESRIKMALDSGAPIQAGTLEAVVETTPAKASTPWKSLYRDVVGEAVVKAREAEAKIAARNRPGTPHVRVFAKETK